MLQIWALEGIPEVTPGIDIVALVAEAAASTLQDGDILIVTSKIVSKAEGRIIAADDREDAITAETVRVVATRTSPSGHTTRIVENRLGMISAAAGVDASNTPSGTVLLLPEDPDASARRLAEGLRERTGALVGVLLDLGAEVAGVGGDSGRDCGDAELDGGVGRRLKRRTNLLPAA